jgi:hypothetical protein
MTTERKLPTTVEPIMMRMTGMRIAQTRGRKKLWRKWSSSTNGCEGQYTKRWESVTYRTGARGVEGAYHEQCPDGVVDEDGGCCNEHAEAHETVELVHC